MRSFVKLLLAGLFLSYASLASAQISVDPQADPTSAGAWSGGNASGEGNFMSVCASCHGYEGKGDGVLSEELDVKPRDLSNPKLMTTKSDDHLFKVIKEGGASVGLSENMTPFNEQISDEEIKNVIAYLRSDICKCAFSGK
ncbi:MAG: cytochrome c [Rhodospirillaceae bacterium]|nr:cytochrome c [Rhodospirillaceae bacterium]